MKDTAETDVRQTAQNAAAYAIERARLRMNFGSLFTGIGGFDLGLERAGMECAWQVEKHSSNIKLLEKHWPEVKRYADIRESYTELESVDLICGGDPCPKHSRARSNGESNTPDLSGYFLAVVGRLRPRWVVRENVPAPTVNHFDAALAHLGYGTVVIRMDAAEVTRQSRQRDFVIGCYQATRESVRKLFQDFQNGPGTYTTQLGTRAITPALTTHRTRYDSRDCYIYESERLRILDGDERDRLAGFPDSFTAGFSEAARARFCGNAVIPELAYIIGKRVQSRPNYAYS